MSTSEIPRWPVIEAHLGHDDDGTVTASVKLPDGATRTVNSPELPDAREEVIALVAAYARENIGHATRLAVSDPDGRWLVGIRLDGTSIAVDDDHSNGAASAGSPRSRILDGDERPPTVDTSRPHNPSAPASPEPRPTARRGAQPRRPGARSHTPSRAAQPKEPLELDRARLHRQHRGLLAEAATRWRQRLKDPRQLEEEAADQRLARRYTLTDTNYIVLSSNKGGPGKTTVSLMLGDALASRLPNQRVLVVDFNPGGGALGAAASEDRQAQFSLLQLHAERARIDRHSKLEPYVASLASGLDLLAVPPDPAHALQVTPEHSQQLFHELLAPNYNLILLDTSPDIMNPVTQWAQLHGTQIIIVIEQGYLSGKVVEHGLRYLLHQPAAGENGRQATVVINKVLDDPRAGSIEETERALRQHHDGPLIRIPWDLDLRAQIDLGDYTLDQVRRRSTRLPIKQLALQVTERFI